MKFITILQRGGGGVFPIYYNITRGRGGVSRDPKFVLRNIWTAPYMLVIVGAQQHTDWLKGFQRYDLLKSEKRVKIAVCEQTHTLSAQKDKTK